MNSSLQTIIRASRDGGRGTACRSGQGCSPFCRHLHLQVTIQKYRYAACSGLNRFRKIDDFSAVSHSISVSSPALDPFTNLQTKLREMPHFLETAVNVIPLTSVAENGCTIYVHRCASDPHSIELCPPHASQNSFTDQVGFEFCDRANEGQEEPSHRPLCPRFLGER